MTIMTNPEKINKHFAKYLLTNHASLIQDKTDEDTGYITKTKEILNKIIREVDETGYFTPTYSHSKSDKMKVKRIFPKLSITALPRKLRNTLLTENYVDVDMKNSAFNVMLSYCKINNLPHSNISKYIKKKEKVISSFMSLYDCDKDTAKEYYTKLLYKRTKKSDALYKDDSLRAVIDEIHALQDYIFTTHQDISQPLLSSKKSNPYGKATAELYFRIEINILKEAIEFMKSKGFKCACPLHDGFNIEKSDLDICSSIDELNKYIFEKLKYQVYFTQKPMNDVLPCLSENKFNMKVNEGSIKLEPTEDELYQLTKCLFENDLGVFKIIHESSFAVPTYDGITTFTKQNLKMAYEDWDGCPEGYSMDDFFERWFPDSKKKKFDRVDFIPDNSKVPQGVFNLFEGFEVANLSNSCTDDDFSEQDHKDYKLIHEHFKFVCNDDSEQAEPIYNYFLDWIAHIFQHPTEKTNTAIILKGQQGCGKSITCEFLGHLLNYDKYYFKTADPLKDLFGNFNSIGGAKMLIALEEAESNVSSKIYERMKEAITATKRTLNEKFVKERKQNDFARYILATNNEVALKIDDNERRMVCIECTQPRIDGEVFRNSYAKALFNKKAQVLFYRHLLTRDIEAKSWSNYPKTKYYMRALAQTTSPLNLFLNDIINEPFEVVKGNDTILAKDFSSKYNEWCSTNRYHPKKKIGFKSDIEALRLFFNTHSNKGQRWDFKRQEVINYLKKLGLTPEAPDLDESGFDAL